MNKLFYGDNIDVLRRFVRDESVDLCYIDPPFNSKRNYNQIYNNIGREDAAQAQAFVDTWTWDNHANECLSDILDNKNGVQTAQSISLIQGLESVLGRGSLLAYLVNMTVRIAEIHRTLKTTGSFYLHCDDSADSYLRLICDAIFVPQGGDFKNEIIWKRTTAHSDANRFGRNADRIHFYTKSDNYTFNQLYSAYDKTYLEKTYKEKDEKGHFMSDNLTGAGITKGGSDVEWNGYKPSTRGRHWAIPVQPVVDLVGKEKASLMTSEEKLNLLYRNGLIFLTKNGTPRFKRYLDLTKGVALQEIWTDINSISAHAQERLGYPTQKPEALLERIIKVSSNEGDTVLDAFCGCGTTVAAAQKLKRRWTGIDITYQSISLIMKRLRKIEGAAELVELHGIPRDLQSVKALINKKDDRVRKEFEKWAVLTFSDNLAVINEKRGADKGVDGVAYTITGRDNKGSLKSMPVIFSVKSGHVNSSVIRDLHGTVEREKAAAGILITLEEPSKPMIQEAKQAGQFKGDFASFDRLQIVTVKEILDNKKMNLPMSADLLKQGRSDSGSKQLALY
jgi:DNA modification methylase